MYRAIFILSGSIFIGYLCAGCGSGQAPDTSVSVTQSQDNTQVQNEQDLNCEVSCTISANGLVGGSKECQGGAVFVLAVQSLDECDSIEDHRQDSEVEAKFAEVA